MGENGSLHLNQPDTTYRLSTAARSRVLPIFDVEAVERLLQHAKPELRAHFLALLSRQEERSSFHWSHLKQINDPVLHAILEEVYQPFWRTLPDDAFTDLSMDAYPGRMLAAKRRGKA